MIWDVAVIGAGPAGSAVAIHCREAGLRTAIFSAARGGSSAVPETLPVAARPLLEGLGIRAECGLRPQYAMSSAWGSDSLTTRDSICNPAGPGWFVERPAFDAAVARRAIEAGATPFPNSRIASARHENGQWELGFHSAGAATPVKAAFVVDATGRASAFARRIGVRRIALDRLIAVSARAIPRGRVAGEGLVESACDGWWFSAPAAGGELSVTWFTEAPLLQAADRSNAAFESRLAKTTHTAARVSSLVAGSLHFRPARTDRLAEFCGEHWMAVGDAALACDPIGSQGLLRAFESANQAREMIVRNRTINPEQIRVYEEFHIYYLKQFLRDRHYFYSMERRWPDSPFWRTPR
jgi:flavin-dependent dehydrogenase